LRWEDLPAEAHTSQKLADGEIMDLAQMAISLERQMSSFCDIEWCRKGAFHIVQCRPLTVSGPPTVPVEDDKWTIVVSHPSDLFTQDVVLSGIRMHASLSKYGLTFSHPFVKYEHSTGNIYWRTEQVEEIRTTILPMTSYEQLVADLRDEIANFSRFLSDWASRDTKPTAKFLLDTVRQMLRATGTIARFHLEEPLALSLQESGMLGNIAPSGPTETSEAYGMLAHLGSSLGMPSGGPAQVDQALLERLLGFCDSYGHLGMKYFKGRPWNAWDVYTTIREGKGPEGQERRDSPSATSDPRVKVLSELLQLRTRKWEAICRAGRLFRDMVERHFSGIIAYDDLLNFRLEEAIDLLAKGKWPDPREISRRENFELLLTNEGVKIIESATPSSPLQGSHFLLPGQIINGRPGAPGQATGRARIVMTPRDCSRVQEGDVLISAMSTPDFLPAMQRACAFVTDRGGATTHAVLVAREAGKPCVTATGNATRVLKDDTWLEVDGTQGIVRVLGVVPGS
jgi:phosphohistidine swiveling domain-containing protein